MNCPHCNIPLLMTDRQGVEIDYCSTCRGVWLDRGELDKIIELSTNNSSNTQSHGSNNQHGNQNHNQVNQSPQYQPNYKSQKHYSKHKKPKSILGEIFDIF